MPTEQDMIDRINAEQGEGIRLAEHVYISWLEDLGDPRAEAWRVLIEAGKRPDDQYAIWHWWYHFPMPKHSIVDFLGDNHDEILGLVAPGRPYFFDAMNDAAAAWVRTYREPEFDPLGMMGVYRES